MSIWRKRTNIMIRDSSFLLECGNNIRILFVTLQYNTDKVLKTCIYKQMTPFPIIPYHNVGKTREWGPFFAYDYLSCRRKAAVIRSRFFESRSPEKATVSCRYFCPGSCGDPTRSFRKVMPLFNALIPYIYSRPIYLSTT